MIKNSKSLIKRRFEITTVRVALRYEIRTYIYIYSIYLDQTHRTYARVNRINSHNERKLSESLSQHMIIYMINVAFPHQ